MPGLNVTAKNAMLDGSGTVWPPDTVSLHTADPGSGTSPNAGELTGGSPAYARVAITWAAAATSAKSSNASVTWNVPAGSAPSHVGYWRSTTFLGSRALTVAETAYGAQGTYAIPSGSLTESLT